MHITLTIQEGNKRIRFIYLSFKSDVRCGVAFLIPNTLTLRWLPAAPLVLAALLVYPHVAAVYPVPHPAVLAQHQPRQQQHQHRPVL